MDVPHLWRLFLKKVNKNGHPFLWEQYKRIPRLFQIGMMFKLFVMTMIMNVVIYVID